MTDIDTTTPADTTTEERPEQPLNERRAMLRKIALGGAGAAVGTMALSSRASAGDSAGTTIGGNAVELGVANTSDTPTTIEVTPATADSGQSALSVGGYVPSADSPFPAAIGGYGDDTISNGLHGSTTASDGFGAVAASLAPAAGDLGGVPAALAVAALNGAQIRFVGLDGAVVGPNPGLHYPSELYVDAEGTLWFTVPVADSDTDVRFVKLAGTPTAGSLHTLAFPVRVFDTRIGDDPVKPAADSVSEVDLTTKLDGSDSGLGAGSTAALLNITIADSDNKGFFSVSAAGVQTPDAEVFSSGNWTQAGTNLGTSVTTAISADGKIDIELGPEGGTHLIVDVVGYYL
ncbi:MAG: hypothetical protein WA964_19900 [Ilumatobacter sp.]|uniref:hypothetical protein n=1 Tax=Ilumatobacter sp. TaxID=1967498 RepID=UPI003C77E945